MKFVVLLSLCFVSLLLVNCQLQPSPITRRTDGHKNYDEFMAGIKGGSYEAPEPRKHRIREHYPLLRGLMSKAEILSLIGEPDYSEAAYGPKGPNEKWLGWTWKYFLVWPDTANINDKVEGIQIAFDTNDRAEWIAPMNKTLPQTSGQSISKDVRTYTTQLPAIDKIEIQKVSGGEGIEKIENTKTLSGTEAQTLAGMWRTQQYDDKYSASCHEPAYAIKFYTKEKLISYVSICWNCRNMYSLLAENKFGIGFNARNAKGKALLQFFQTRLG